ncbi:hypothetical protein D3C72_2428880 [compost metagenome]
MIKFALGEIMEMRGWTPKDIEEKTGLSRNTVKALVANINTRIDFPTLDTLCTNLELKPGDLIVHEPDKPRDTLRPMSL